MARRLNTSKRRGLVPAALAYTCAAALALGGTGIALAAVSDSIATVPAAFSGFTPASLSSGLSQLVGNESSGMRFTPAGASASRSITVAVRIDDRTARAMSLRSAIAGATDQFSGRTVEIAPTRYDLGIARGYQSFAQAKPAMVVATTPLADIAMPDLSEFRPSPGVASKPSRFSARVALENDRKTGRADGTLESLGEQRVDVGGALRVTRNLNVTAGVRYSQDRDRIAPLTDGEMDNQAVYLGTQFRF